MTADGKNGESAAALLLFCLCSHRLTSIVTMNVSASEVYDWFVENYERPLLIFTCAMLIYNLPTLIYKLKLSFQAILYLLFCHDKKWNKPQDPASIFAPVMSTGGSGVTRKTVYFVRHGESCWNDTFNKGHHRSAVMFAIGFIPGLIKAVLYELYFILTGMMDSWFYDSPLSNLGLMQVDELAVFLKKTPTKDDADLVAVLRADPGAPPSRILCSSLRRAVSTLACGFQERLARRPEEKVLVVPPLQEISRNPDTLSITPPFTQVTASWIDKKSTLCDFQATFDNHVDMSLHTGNKPINTNGLIRMDAFNEFVFSPSVAEDHVIVGGHSIWFRSYFKTFLPYGVDHAAKKKKIVNAGVVAFDLLQLPTPKGNKYMIDPKSIRVAYGGFS